MSFLDTDAAVADLARRRKRTNLVHSTCLLGGMLLLLAACGWILAGWEGVAWSFVAGALGILFGPRLSPPLVLRLFGARRMARHEAPVLFDIVEAVAGRADLPAAPTLHYIASPALNAFAVGSPRQAAVAVTDGLLRALSPRELAGVLAHEISHVRNNDLFVMGLADTVASLTRFMSLFGMALLLLNLPLLLMEREPIPWALVLVLAFAPAAGALLQLALSRTREFDADLDAAYLTGDPEGIASALATIERLQGRQWERLPLTGRRFPTAEPSLLRTHPTTEERVRRLLELAPPPPVLPGLETMPLHVAFPHVVRRPRYRLSGYWY